MVATDPDSTNPPEGGEGASPEPTEPEGTPKEAQMVPLTALHEERSKRQERDKSLQEANARTAELEKQLADRNDPNPAPAISPEQAKEFTDFMRIQKLGRELRLGEAQTAAVLKTMDSAPTLNAAEALTLAKLREPDVFKSDDGSGYVPGLHGSLPTSRGADPAPLEEDDTDARKKRIRELDSTDQMAADELRNNLIGSLAADVLGLPHKRIPIT